MWGSSSSSLPSFFPFRPLTSLLRRLERANEGILVHLPFLLLFSLLFLSHPFLPFVLCPSCHGLQNEVVLHLIEVSLLFHSLFPFPSTVPPFPVFVCQGRLDVRGEPSNVRPPPPLPRPPPFLLPSPDEGPVHLLIQRIHHSTLQCPQVLFPFNGAIEWSLDRGEGRGRGAVMGMAGEVLRDEVAPPNVSEVLLVVVVVREGRVIVGFPVPPSPSLSLLLPPLPHFPLSFIGRQQQITGKALRKGEGGGRGGWDIA